MKKIQINIDWNVVFWLGIMIIFFWLIAKASGLINTPLVIQIIPYIGGLIALFGLFRNIGVYIQKLNGAIEKINITNIEVKDIRLDIGEIRKELHSIDKRVAIVESKI